MHYLLFVTNTLEDSYDSQLEPYNENEDWNTMECYESPKWDWYEVGGRWTGFLKLKKNAPDTPYIGGHFSMSEEDKKKLANNGRTDVACVGEIDWEEMHKEAEKQAADNYEKSKNNDYWGVKPLVDETKEDFVKRTASIAPYAILHEGEWFERDDYPEDKDWDNKFNDLLTNWLKNRKNMEITVIDYHG